MKTVIFTIMLTINFGLFAQSESVKIENKQALKTQLIGEWEFHEITIVTPKDGYLMRISDRETAMINLLVANYTFKKDGSISLDPKYMEKQGVKSATWEMDDSSNLSITVFWTAEKQEKEEYSNDYEKINYKVTLLPNKKLTLNLQDMFIVNLVHK